MENKQVKQKFPIGMILILTYLGGTTVASLPMEFKFPIFQLGPVLLTGAGAIIINLIITGIVGIICYGIIKKLRWTRKLVISWLLFKMILLSVNLLSFLANTTMYDSFYQKYLTPEEYSQMTPSLLIMSSISSLAINSIIGIIIINYVIKKKEFFVR